MLRHGGAGGADPWLESACGLRACCGAFGRAAPAAAAVCGAVAGPWHQAPPKLSIIFAGTLLGAVLASEQSDAVCAPKKEARQHWRAQAACQEGWPGGRRCLTWTELGRGRAGGREGGSRGQGVERGQGFRGELEGG